MKTAGIWKYIHAERAAVADTLEGLTPQQWAAPSWCGHWTVHMTAAHILVAAEQTPGRFYFQLLRAGLRFNSYAERTAQSLVVLDPSDLVARLRARTTTTACTKTWSRQGHQLPGPPDRGHEHRPRRAHPADHPRPGHPGQGPVRPLRRADDGGKRARRLHQRVPPDALTSGVPLNVDLDTTLTVVAGNLYRLLALKLDRYETATPDKIWRDFLEATGTMHIGPDGSPAR